MLEQERLRGIDGVMQWPTFQLLSMALPATTFSNLGEDGERLPSGASREHYGGVLIEHHK
ncbi:MAG: hypothetical protein AAF683_01710 [Pseudomonadota bacterium]